MLKITTFSQLLDKDGTDVGEFYLFDNEPPKFPLAHNVPLGDVNQDMRNEGDGGKWLRIPLNTSSIENCFNYTSFPHEDENSVLLQQGAVATLDTRNYSLVRHNQYLDYQTYTLYSADPSNNISIQIPVLFDVSGSALLYGKNMKMI